MCSTTGGPYLCTQTTQEAYNAINSRARITLPLKTEPYPVSYYKTDVPADFQSAFYHLKCVMERYTLNEDYLSKALFQWIGEALSVGLGKSLRDKAVLQELQPEIRKKLDELQQTILVNPLTQAPLKDPILDRMWVWERTLLEEYMKGSTISPFDQIPFDPMLKSHAFAEEMLAWSSGLICSASSAEGPSPSMTQEQMIILNMLSLADETQRGAFYQMLAGFTARLQQSKEDAQMYKSATDAMLHEFKVGMQKRLVLVLTQKKEELAAHDAQITARINALTQTHLKEMEQMQQKANHLSSQASILETKLSQSQQTLASYHHQVSQLQTCYTQRANEIEYVSRNNNRGGGLCD